MKVLFWVGVAITIFVPFVVKIIFDDTYLIWISLLIGAFVTLISHFDRLAELSLGPLKARMKEKLAQTEATLDQLQKLALTITEATLTDLIAGSFMGSMSLAKRIQLKNELIKTLKDIGIGDEKITQAETGWRKGISVIYHRNIRWRAAGQKDANRIDPNVSEKNKKAGKEINALLDFSNWLVASPAKIREVLNKYDVKNDEVDEWLANYEHFLKTGEIIGVDEFVKN